MAKRKLMEHDGAAIADQSDFVLKINEDFAKKYELKKRTEELGQLEDKYRGKLKGKNVQKQTSTAPGIPSKSSDEEDEEDSESDCVEDEDGELVTPAIDAQILKTLAEIRARDSKIYDSNVKFFNEAELKEAEEAWKAKQKSFSTPMRLADYQRERLLAGKLNGDAEPEEASDYEEAPLTHYEEQEALKNEFKIAIDGEIKPGDDNTDDLFRFRPKTAEEVAREEEDYKAFLLENLSKSTNAVESMSHWLDYRDKKGVDPDEQFLIDYVLKRGWIDQERKALPNYEKIVAEDEEDLEVVEKAEEYEAALNFRFEQPGATQIITYPRDIEGSLRRTESKRKAERAAKKTRKAEEALHRQEELKRLKNLKKAELLTKLENIKRVSGTKVDDETLLGQFEDLEESDFDPQAHDRKMQKLFGEAFYAQSSDDENDNDKPEFSDISDIESKDEMMRTKIIKKASKALKRASSAVTSESTGGDEEPSKQMVKKTKQKLLQRLDELYDLDYEDVIGGDLTCRFKYTNVTPTSFGLSQEEILEIEDPLLNAHASMKKLAPYRPSNHQEADRKKLEDKRRLYMFRKGVKEAKAKKKEARELAKSLSQALHRHNL